MSYRKSAELFGRFFEYLARTPDDPEARAFARELYQDTGDYDFLHRQMECDEALVALGLAKKEKNLKFGGDVYRYLGEHYEEKNESDG